MISKGYNDISKSFLNKTFGDITVNITVRDSKVEAITAFKDNEITNVPLDLLKIVKTDIKDSF